MRYQAYPEYKDSGVEWLGEVPIDWEVSKFAYVKTVLTDYTANGSFAGLKSNVQYLDKPSFARLIRLTDLRKDLKNDNGVWIDQNSYKYLSKSALYGGEFLLANVGAYAGLFYQMPRGYGRASLAPNMFMAKFDNRKVTEEFMAYIGMSKPIYDQLRLKATASSAQPKLNKDDFKSIRFPIPTSNEQNLIRNFLDKELPQIDKLISKQKKLIELLKEKRLAVISHAVTKGINPDVKMKDSGVEWLGGIPEHWQIKKLKYLFDIRKRIAGTLGYDVLSITQQGIKIKDIESGEGQLSMDYGKYQIVEEGDYAMNHMDLLTGFVDISRYKGVTSPDYRVFSLIDKESMPEYYLLLLQMGYLDKIFYAFGQGSSQLGRWRFPTEQFKSFVFPYPPKSEQIAIAEKITAEHKKIDKLFSKCTKAIELLKERRTALISSAVTGKIDVRNA